MIDMECNVRGFRFWEFKDANGEKCSIQERSSVSPCLWLGLDDVRPKAMSIAVPGLPPPVWKPDEGSTKTSGWSSCVLPSTVHCFGRMHLDQKMALELAALLYHFARHGALPEPGESPEPLNPPLGLVPRFIEEEHRANAILKAMGRYTARGMSVPAEWREELAELLDRIGARAEGAKKEGSEDA